MSQDLPKFFHRETSLLVVGTTRAGLIIALQNPFQLPNRAFGRSHNRMNSRFVRCDLLFFVGGHLCCDCFRVGHECALGNVG